MAINGHLRTMMFMPKIDHAPKVDAMIHPFRMVMFLHLAVSQGLMQAEEAAELARLLTSNPFSYLP